MKKALVKKVSAGIIGAVLTAVSMPVLPAVNAEDDFQSNAAAADINTADGYISGKTDDGCDWEAFNSDGKGTAEISVKNNGAFSASWDNIQQYYAYVGKKWDEPLTWRDCGGITCDFDADFDPSADDYLVVSGFFRQPYLEYHICENYGENGRSTDPLRYVGEYEADGAVYEVYLSVVQIFISPIDTPRCLFALRAEDKRRNSGTVSLDEHFKAWSELCEMDLRGLVSAEFGFEAWQSSGSIDVKSSNIALGDQASAPDMPEVTKGDLNGDGRIDSFDIILEKQAVIVSVKGGRIYDPAADIDGDENIGVNDLVLLTKFLLGEIDRF